MPPKNLTVLKDLARHAIQRLTPRERALLKERFLLELCGACGGLTDEGDCLLCEVCHGLGSIDTERD